MQSVIKPNPNVIRHMANSANNTIQQETLTCKEQAFVETYKEIYETNEQKHNISETNISIEDSKNIRSSYIYVDKYTATIANQKKRKR